MKLPIILTASIIIFLQGCVSPSGPLGGLPKVSDSEKSGQVVIVRPSNFAGSANGFIVALDGRDIASIGSGENIKFRVAEGEHFIALKCNSGWSAAAHIDAHKFISKATETNYFLINISIAHCGEILPSTENEARHYLAGSKFIDIESY